MLCVHLATPNSLHSAINREQYEKHLLQVWILQKIQLSKQVPQLQLYVSRRMWQHNISCWDVIQNL